MKTVIKVGWFSNIYNKIPSKVYFSSCKGRAIFCYNDIFFSFTKFIILSNVFNSISPEHGLDSLIFPATTTLLPQLQKLILLSYLIKIVCIEKKL